MLLLNFVRTAIRAQHLFTSDETVVVGVSGGPDSLVLLHVLQNLSAELGISLHVAHLNHQLRGAESDADAAFVANLAREWNLPATVESRDVAAYAREQHLSLEEAARVARYRFLADTAARIDAHTIAVAHQADDQAETILMHFLRGAGMAGLRGMQYQSEMSNMNLVRPLLEVTRVEIEVYCREHDLQPRADQSNLDTTIFRNRLRHEVIPYLEQFNPNLREVWRHSGHALADDYECLRGQVERAFAQVARRAECAWVFDHAQWRALEPSLQRATLREAVRQLRQGLRNINWTHIENARRVALEKGVGAEATLLQGLMLVVGYDEFTIGETMQLPDVPLLHREMIQLPIGTEIQLPETDWFVSVRVVNDGRRAAEDAWCATFDADKILGAMVLRTRRAGERFQPSGLGGRHKSLHEFMIDEKIPRHVRDLWPILADEEKILWVCGQRVDERARVTEETTRVVKVEFFKNTAIM